MSTVELAILSEYNYVIKTYTTGGIFMHFYEKQIDMTIQLLKSEYRKKLQNFPLSFTECGYKQDNILPPVTPEWSKSEGGCRLTGRDKHYWVHTVITTPGAQDAKRVVLSVATDRTGWDADNPQCIVYIDGQMVCGMDVNHTEYPLEFGRTYDVYIYYYTGPKKDDSEKGAFLEVGTALLDEPVRELYYDLDVPHKAAACFDEEDEEFITIIKHLGIAVNMLDLCNIGSEEYYRSIEDAHNYMHNVFYKQVCNADSPVVVTGIGHTHIDVAWLWTYAQTKEKVQRSFSTVLALMEQYPEYKFMSSQPQLYKYLKEEAPEIYEKVKEKIAEGRWEVEGGMWVEADCNLISGESMVRQFMHGKKFIYDEFGKDSKILWLPDVFGYSAAMPQILKKCGIDKFFTSKISWNETNKLPYDTFYWQGIDGTEIFSYFATAQDYIKHTPVGNITTYVAKITPQEVKGTWNRYQQKAYNTEVISTFGFGDGGGGPTDWMLESQRRTKYGIPGIPRTDIDFAGNILSRVKDSFDKNCAAIKETPKWCGELYLEFHRGTYTNMAKNKKYNRKSELLYQYAEAASVFDMILTGGAYDSEKLYNNWKTILLNQFHDVIPGSSIKEVYEDTDKMYDKLMSEGEAIVSEKLSSVASQINAEDGIIVFNPTGFMQSGVAEYEGRKYFCRDIPAYGWKHIKVSETQKKASAKNNTAENEYYILTLDENANIASLYDKRAQREVLSGAGNRLELYEDRPYQYDGWELSPYHKHKCRFIDEVSEAVPFEDNVSAGFIIKRAFSNSVITQKIVLYAESERIDFETEIDWHENNMILKTAFPIDVFASKATYDIQFGNIERPTHRNTSWDQAKFEVCAHKWADISDYGYGVSLLNDCKYGHSTEGSTLRLTFLKAANYPNPESDRGINTFTYSLLPHKGDFRSGGTVREAYLLNNPLRCTAATGAGGMLPTEHSMVSCGSENIVIDTIKKSESGNDVIIRAYECYNTKCSTELHFGFDVEKAFVCDMLENNEYELEVNNNTVKVPFGNFEVVTVKAVTK